MVPPASVRVSRALTYSGSHPAGSLFAYGSFTLFAQTFQSCFAKLTCLLMVLYPKCKHLVWPASRSLAATWEIAFAFFSCGYLDVSVLRVPFDHTTLLI